jgi:RHS repeat-associated protein
MGFEGQRGAGARYYSNVRGRWLSVDPVLGDMANPKRLNRYGYVLNDPVNYVDPDGANPMSWSYGIPIIVFRWSAP